MKTLFTGTLMLILVTLAACKKDKNTQDTACANLINDAIPASDSCYIVVPNAFTPNLDGRNDWMFIFTKNIQTANLKIFNTSGSIVYETDDLSKPWKPDPGSADGKTFYYRIEAVTITDKRMGKCGALYPLHCVPKNSGNKYNFQTQFNGLTIDTSIPAWEYQCP